MHLVQSGARCHISNALDSIMWSRPLHTASYASQWGCMWGRWHVQNTHEARDELPEHHTAAQSVAGTHADCSHRLASNHISPVATQQRCISRNISATSQCMSSRHSHHHRSSQHRSAVLNGTVPACMRSMCAGAVKEKDVEASEEVKPPTPDSLFHEELTFDADGFAVSHVLSPLVVAERQRESATKGDSDAAVAPAVRSEALVDSLSGMLCILQLLPDETSEWIATYLGFHSVHAMVKLRRDLDVGQFDTVVGNAAEYCNADSAAGAQLSGKPQSDSSERAHLQELLLDDGLPSLLRLTDGSEVPLPHTLPSVYVLANLNRLNELLRSQPDMVGQDGVLMSMEDTNGDVSDSLGRLHAGERLLGSSESYTQVLRGFGRLFSPLRRVGISRTLHRVACIEGVDGVITGLTLRIGRHVPAAAWPLTDVLAMIDREHRRSKYSRQPFDLQGDPAQTRSGLPCSVLVLGGPASGKTTILRDISQQLSVRFGLGRRVVIVDSSSEIGGQGQVHSSFCMSCDDTIILIAHCDCV